LIKVVKIKQQSHGIHVKLRKRSWVNLSELIGYVGLSHIGTVREADLKCLTIINLAFGTVKENEIDWDADQYVKEISRAQKINPALKILLSVGGWGCGGFSTAAATVAGRKAFAKSAKAMVERGGLDGIDLDWEYPCLTAAGIDAAPEDKENFTLLLREIRRELDLVATKVRPMLTIAAGGGAYYLENTRMNEVQELLDYVQIMTYDLKNAYVTQTGHHTNLYSYAAAASEASVDHAVQLFLAAGVPPEKIVIGAAFYSRMWEGVNNQNQGYNQPAATIGNFGPDYGELVKDYVNQNGFQRYWDQEAKAPYLFNGATYISYDDETSIRLKIDYLLEKGLRGIMYWEYKCDTTHTLTQIMAEQLNKRLV